VFTATATYAAYHIDYYDGINNTPGSDEIGYQTNAYNTASTIQINPTFNSGSAPTRNTYTLKSWCMDSGSNIAVYTSTEDVFNSTNTMITAYNYTATICYGTEYALDGTITIDPTEYNTNLKLYAIWEPTTFDQAYAAASKTKTDNYYVMQDMDSTICAAVSNNQYITLRDNRVPTNDTTGSSQTYTVGKLEDGRCWMADNLNLDIYTYRNSLNASNTHFASTLTANDINKILTSFKSGNRSAGDRYANGGITADWTTGTSYSVPLQNRGGKCDPNSTIYGTSQCLSPYNGNRYTYATVIDKYGIPGSDSSGTATISYNFGFGSYIIGTHYNYCATSLGSYCHGNGGNSGSTATSDSTDADICPAGWRLPTGGPTGETGNLADILAANYPTTWNIASSPYSFQAMYSVTFSGNYNRDTAMRQGAYAHYWTSTNASTSSMRRLGSNGEGVGTTASYQRYIGYSVRCIAQN
ncbi:MAG: hypothetical protein Q4F58_02050, partial [Candidatus Saccharibacteria bacterium]|nr:hypothetical protein [Candidatus Saccharibacteria bacterium]